MCQTVLVVEDPSEDIRVFRVSVRIGDRVSAIPSEFHYHAGDHYCAVDFGPREGALFEGALLEGTIPERNF